VAAGHPGCGVLSVAVIIREIVGVSRFRSKDPYARFTGPPRSRSGLATPWESAQNHGGSQAVNCALHMIAVTQALGIGPGKEYIAKQEAVGKTSTEALRLLCPRLFENTYRALHTEKNSAADSGSIAAT
jgi:transposase